MPQTPTVEAQKLETPKPQSLFGLNPVSNFMGFTVNPQPQTPKPIRPQHQTRNPKPYIQNPSPQTLNRQTLNPKPQPKPKPSTVNPNPLTLNPNPKPKLKVQTLNPSRKP